MIICCMGENLKIFSSASYTLRYLGYRHGSSLKSVKGEMQPLYYFKISNFRLIDSIIHGEVIQLI